MGLIAFQSVFGDFPLNSLQVATLALGNKKYSTMKYMLSANVLKADFQLLFVLFSCCHSSSSANTELYINININIKHNFLGRNTEKKQLEEPQNLCYCGHQIFKVFSLGKIKSSNGGSGQMHQNHTTV